MILDHIYLVILGCISLALLFMRRQLSFQDKVLLTVVNQIDLR